MKNVSETAAGKHISARVVLKKGKHVATVRAHYANSGGVTVNVINMQGNDPMYTGKASGYGYDKFAAALSGAVIDGVKMFNHSGTDEKTEKILKDYLSGKTTEEQAKEKARKIGASFANYFDGKYESLYYRPGLSRLSMLGYTVIQAI